MRDDLGNEPERSTEKQYCFETVAGVRLNVWADAYWIAREKLAGAGFSDAVWVGTSPSAGVLIESTAPRNLGGFHV